VERVRPNARLTRENPLGLFVRFNDDELIPKGFARAAVHLTISPAERSC
jgi:hypothetical protein